LVARRVSKHPASRNYKTHAQHRRAKYFAASVLGARTCPTAGTAVCAELLAASFGTGAHTAV
jgi:hypothetical protein